MPDTLAINALKRLIADSPARLTGLKGEQLVRGLRETHVGAKQQTNKNAPGNVLSPGASFIS
jgi:hypothetical protein